MRLCLQRHACVCVVCPFCTRSRACARALFQKRSVSAAAALTTVVPSGDCAMCSTRDVWPVSSATLTIEGYFQRMSWLCE